MRVLIGIAACMCALANTLTTSDSFAQDVQSVQPAAPIGDSATQTTGDSQAEFADDSIRANLRLKWSAEQNQNWIVRMSIADGDHGGFSNLRNHCSSDLAAGAFVVNEDTQSVLFAPRLGMNNGELRIRYDGPTDSQIQITVHASPNRQPKLAAIPPTKTIMVRDLLSGQPINILDNSLPIQADIRRLANDGLQISNHQHQSNPIKFGEQIKFDVRTSGMLKHAGKELQVVYELHRLADGKVIASGTKELSLSKVGVSEKRTLQIKSPTQAGVYELRCQLTDPENLWSRLRRPNVFATAAQSVVVLPNPNRQPSDVEQLPWKVLARLAPTKRPGWELTEWLPSTISPVGKPTQQLRQAKHVREAVSLLEPNQVYKTSLPRMRAGWPHKITVRYPNGQRLKLKCEISGANGFPKVEHRVTLSDVPSSDQLQAWRTQSFWYYPKGSQGQLRIQNITERDVLSFAEVKVEAGPYRINPQPDSNRGQSRTVALMLDDFRWPERLGGDVSSLGKYSPMSRQLYQLFTATRRLQDYVQTCGYNAVVLPINRGAKSWHRTEVFAPNENEQTFADRAAIVGQLLEISQVKILWSVDSAVALTPIEISLKQFPQSQSSILRMRGGYLDSQVYNFQNPSVLNTMATWFQQLSEDLSTQSNFGGIVVIDSTRGHCQTLSADNIFDPNTLQSIAQLSPEAQSLRSGVELRRWAQSKGRSLVQQWCDSQTAKAWNQLGARVGGNVHFLGREVPSINEPAKYLSLTDQTRAADDKAHQSNQAAEYVLIRCPVESSDGGSAVHANSTKARLTDVLAHSDPKLLVFREPRWTGAWSGSLANQINVVKELPVKALSALACSDPGVQTVHVRHGSDGESSIISIYNQSPWAYQVELITAGDYSWQGLNESTEPGKTNWTVSGNSLRALIGPQDALTLKSPGTANSKPVTRWLARVHGGSIVIDQIKNQVTAVVERMGNLGQPDRELPLRNQGFEQTTTVGIPGWMHTQHPPTAVKIDSREAAEGKQSVVMTTDPRNPARTWIVSEQLRPPASGRLAVSLACRAQLDEMSSTPHKIRVSIEGQRVSGPLRYAKELNVPRDGQWQPRVIALEVDDIDPTTVRSIRLTIDSLSAGRVWVDDIHLHDWFPTEQERTELQGEAFMAIQGLQQGDLTAASQLLKNNWAQQLLARQSIRRPTPKQSTPAKPIATEPPSVADRIKDWIPRPLRF